MKTKILPLLVASLGLAVAVPTIGWSLPGHGKSAGAQGPGATFSNGDLKVTNFKAVRFSQADNKNPYSNLVLKGTPRLHAVIASQRASLEGESANMQIDDTAGLLHKGHVEGNVVISVAQPDKDGGQHVTTVTSPAAEYENQGTKAAPAFNLQLKSPTTMTSAYALKKELATISGSGAHFEFATPSGATQPQLQSGVLAGPVKMRFEGLLDKANPSKRTIVTGTADRLEISRAGTDYVIKLVGNVVFDNEGGLHFQGDLGESASFRFTEDFGFKSYDGDGVTSISQDVLNQAAKARKKPGSNSQGNAH